MPSKKSKAVTSPTKAGIQKKKSVIKKSAGKSGASSGGKSQTPKKGKAEDKKQAKSAKNVEADGLGSEANPSGIVIEAWWVAITGLQAWHSLFKKSSL